LSSFPTNGILNGKIISLSGSARSLIHRNLAPLKETSLHKKEIHLSRLEKMGINISQGDFYIPVTKEDEEHVEKLFKRQNRSNRKSTVKSKCTKQRIRC